MAERISRANASLALAFYPQRDEIKLSAVADEMSDDTEILTKSTLGMRKDPRAGATVRTSDLFNSFQKHLHSLAHYQEKTGFFQKSMNRAIPEKNIGLQLFSSEEGKSVYKDILEQMEQAKDNANYAMDNATNEYMQGLSKIIGKEKIKKSKRKEEFLKVQEEKQLEKYFKKIKVVGHEVTVSVIRDMEKIDDQSSTFDELLNSLEKSKTVSELKSTQKKSLSWIEHIKNLINITIREIRSEIGVIKDAQYNVKTLLQAYKDIFESEEPKKIQHFEDELVSTETIKVETNEKLKTFENDAFSKLDHWKDELNKNFFALKASLERKKGLKTTRPPISIPTKSTTNTVASELKKWNERVESIEDLYEWMDGSLSHAEELFKTKIGTNYEEEDKTGVYGQNTSERIVEDKTPLAVFNFEDTEADLSVFRGYYSLLGTYGGESLEYKNGRHVKMSSALNGQEFEKTVDALFRRQWKGNLTSKNYEMPDIDWTVLRPVLHQSLTEKPRKHNTPANKPKNRKPLNWHDGQAIHFITIRPYFGYSPVVVQLGMTLHFDNQDEPTHFDGVFAISYDQESGTSPNQNDTMKKARKSGESAPWDNERDYWNVDYSNWGKNGEEKPGHSVNLVLYELFSGSVITPRSGSGATVFEKITNYFEEKVATNVEGIARWHHVPVQLSLRGMTSSAEGSQLSFVNLLRKMRLPGQTYSASRDPKSLRGGTLTKMDLNGFVLMVSGEYVDDSDVPLYKKLSGGDRTKNIEELISDIRKMPLSEPLHGPPYIWMPFSKTFDESDIGSRVSLFYKGLLEDDDLYELNKEKIVVDVVGEPIPMEEKDEDDEEFFKKLNAPQTAAEIIEEGMKLSGASREMIEASKRLYPPSEIDVAEKKEKTRGPISATSCMEE